MRYRKLLAIALVCFLVSPARSTDVLFSFVNSQRLPQGTRSMELIPLGAPSVDSSSIVTRDRITRSTGADGTITFSNLVGTIYRAEFKGALSSTTNWFSFPETNALINAADPAYITVATNTAGILAYSKAQADSLFLSKSAGSNLVTGSVAPLVSTNDARRLGFTNEGNQYTGRLTIKSNGIPIADITTNGNAIFRSLVASNGNDVYVGFNVLSFGGGNRRLAFQVMPPFGGANAEMDFGGNETVNSQTNTTLDPSSFVVTDANKRLRSTLDGSILSGVIPQTNGSGYGSTLFNANVVTKPLYLMTAFKNEADYQAWELISTDGVKFDLLGPDRIYYVDKGSNEGLRDPRNLVTSTNFYMISGQSYNHASTGPRFLKSTNWWYWEPAFNVDSRFNSSITAVWSSRFALDSTNGLHLFSFQSTNGTSKFQPYEQHLTNGNDITSWSPAVQVTNWLTQTWTNTIDAEVIYWNGFYHWVFKQECVSACAYAALGISTSITGPVTLVSSNDFTGQLGSGYEGFTVIHKPEGGWNLYAEKFSGGGVFVVSCAENNFPAGPWSPRVLVQMPNRYSNPGIIVLTNSLDIQRVMAARQHLQKTAPPFYYIHGQYRDTITGFNIIDYGTNLNGWTEIFSANTNEPAIMNSFSVDTGNPNKDANWILTTYWMGQGGIERGSNWTTLSTLTSSGLTVNLNATNLTGTVPLSATGPSYGSNLIGALRVTNTVLAPTPSLIGANSGMLWVSNASLYYSWTADGSTTNGASLLAPAFHPTRIAGLKYYWDYHDAGISNTAVSAWVDRISGLSMNQTDAGSRPTGTVSGVSFLLNSGGGLASLTNGAFSIPSNYTFWAVCTVHSTFSASQYVPIFGAIGGAAATGLYARQSTAAADYYFSSADHNISDNGIFAAGATVEVAWANGTAYTNGVLQGTTAIPTSYPLAYGRFGSEGPGQGRPYVAIKYFGFWTNTVSASDIASLRQWAQSN